MESSPSSQINTVKCIVCYKPIDPNGPKSTVVGINMVACPNNHLAHSDCIKSWFIKNKNCPVCHSPYSEEILALFQDFINVSKIQEVEKKRQQAEQLVIQTEKAKIKPPIFTPQQAALFSQAREQTIHKNYKVALKILWDLLDTDIKDQRSKAFCEISQHIGMIYYHSGEMSLAINPLTNVIKISMEMPVAFYYLGLAYQKMEMWDKVKWSFERGVEKMGEWAKIDAKYVPLYEYMMRKVK